MPQVETLELFEEIEEFDAMLDEIGDSPVTKDIRISPELAGLVLEEYNIDNIRPIKPSRVAAHRDAIKIGEWDYRIGAIHFSVDKKLDNGQHRLNAIKDCEDPVAVRFEFNMPEFAESYYDLSAFSRTSADALHRLNAYIANGPSAVSAYSEYRYSNKKVQTQKYTEFFEENPGLREALHNADAITKKVRASLAGVISPGRLTSINVILLMHGASEEKITEFWGQCANTAAAQHPVGFWTARTIEQYGAGGGATTNIIHAALNGFVKYLGNEKASQRFKASTRVWSSALEKAIEKSHQ
jgi:hypothetical protein